MRFDYGYDEEQRLGKSYDLNLLRRILPFAAPHRGKLVVSVLLVVAITLLELSVPYITKEIIDRHILPQNRISGNSGSSDQAAPQQLTVDLTDPEVAAVVARHDHLFRIRGDRATIHLANLDRLDQATLSQLRHRDLSGLAAVAGLFMAVVVAIFVFTFVQNLIMELAGHRIMHDLRVGLYRHLQAMPLWFFNRNPVARLVTRTTNDIQNMHDLFTSFISMVFKDMFLLVGIAVVLLAMDWRLALLTFLVLPLVVMTAFGFSMRVRDVFRELRIKVAEINTRFSETISGIKVIQTFRRERENFDAFARLNHDNYLAGMRQINIFAVFMPIIEMLGITSIAIVVYVGGGHVLDQSVSIGVLAAFLAYMKMFFRPIRDLAEKYNILQNAMASAERIFLLMDSPATGIKTGTATIPGPIEEIRFDGVSLAYNGGEPVLESIDLTIKAGETIAIVGATGSGKTSLVNLLVRFYEPTAGTLRVNGIDTASIPRAELRKRIALVMQDPFLFTGSLRSNIFFGVNGFSDDRQATILEASRCSDLIARLPDGLDTRISEGGGSLSSGERQLLSVARAFTADPEIIILDEATSYVDSQTEAQLQQAIANLMRGRTCVVVAHRLTTARTADRIVVLSNGVVMETGTHATLMAARGLYYRLYQLQGR
ncbi:lipid A ABC transporter permease/ATP-binding protein [Desulfosarcina alkanivorans]|uniref:Lipid A ABC transporter permease/ATP-binding protein n=1 Tax=Desulfosarcina alkanivorans TaxID=571177 RepID=A0A5K7YGP8_9BACT|nr:ABC transporter ATP-binding protein [Desulfosarcina alkanivorans]BBO67743.1 lipid A ABC transporter permease/ATP-binding protein [Desulfosarcina alkanivorans]